MSSFTSIINLNDASWVQVSSNRANVTVTNKANQRVYVAIATNQADLNGLTESHYIENKCSISFWNMATGQNVFVMAPNSNASVIVSATDGISSSGSGTTATGLTDTQLRASAVPVTGPITNDQLRAAAIPVTGSFYQAVQPVSGTFFQSIQPVSGTVTATGGDWLTNSQLRASAITVSLGTTIPTALGRANASASLATVLSNEDFAAIGALTETAPTTDTASSGLNGRLQRIAQRLSSLIALLPASLGQKLIATSLSVTIASDQIVPAAISPTSASTAGLVPVATSALSSGLVLKASAGNLYGVNIVTTSAAGYLMIFNAATVPADGVVTPIKCMVIPANSSFNLTYEIPIRMSTGISVAFSSTGPFSKTASATAFLSGDAS